MRYSFAKQAQPNGIVLSRDQIQVIACKRGLEAVAAWAAECMGMGAREAADYERGIIDAFAQTPIETRLLCRIQTDLERAGKPALSTCAGMIFANAAAEALADLEGYGMQSCSGTWAGTRGRNRALERRSY